MRRSGRGSLEFFLPLASERLEGFQASAHLRISAVLRLYYAPLHPLEPIARLIERCPLALGSDMIDAGAAAINSVGEAMGAAVLNTGEKREERKETRSPNRPPEGVPAVLEA